MSFPELVGHGPILKRLLEGSLEGGRLGHALLLSGPSGIGKFALLLALARGLLCEQGPAPACGTCPACRRIAAGSHPDLLVLDPFQAGFHETTIHFIAERENRPASAWSGPSIEGFLRLVAGEGGRRIVLLRDADRLNEEAQNALLKTLEEPSHGVLLGFEAARPAALLETIRSRLVEVRVKCLSAAETREVLRRVQPDLTLTEDLVRLAAGSPGRLLRLLEQGGPEILALLARALAGGGSAATLLAELLAVKGEFRGSTDRARERDQARAILDLGLELVRDGQRAEAGVSREDLVHGALLPNTGRPLRLILPALLEARADLELNLQPAALLERALDRMLHPRSPRELSGLLR